MLNTVDDVTRECLAAVADTSISGRRVGIELTELIAKRGKPGTICAFLDPAAFGGAQTGHPQEWRRRGSPVALFRPPAPSRS